MKLFHFFALILAVLDCSSITLAQEAKRPFTVADDIAFTHFVWGGDAYSGLRMGGEALRFSPNGEFFAALTERGRLDLNRVEDSLRFYRSHDVEQFLAQSEESQPPKPIWILSVLSDKGAVIKDWHWLPDSSGVAYLQRMEDGREQIAIADVRKQITEVLLADEVAGIAGFDVDDRNHYVYMAVDKAARKELEQKQEADRKSPITVVTGRSVWDFIVPSDDPDSVSYLLSPQSKLWAVIGSERFEVKHDGLPLTSADFNSSRMALSPDGQSLVTLRRIVHVPESWEKLYLPPPSPSFPNNIHAGGSASQYVLIELKNGSTRPLTNAPIAGDAGWPAGGRPSWSTDGREVLLPDTFINAKDNALSRPCVAIVDITSNTSSCIEKLKGRKAGGQDFEEGYHFVQSAQFAGAGKDVVNVGFLRPDEASGSTEYKRGIDGTWQLGPQSIGIHDVGRNGLQLAVTEAFDRPPLLVASRQGKSRSIWDPNPQFKDIALGDARIYHWKDKQGRSWIGALYMPADYQTGHHYPLVIQTHGFNESAFYPSGSFPTAFAARELASAGIAVLQVGGSTNCRNETGKVGEASCFIGGYDSGARQLSSDGLVDPERIGYIGFSRTCYYGMQALTDGPLSLKAVSLTDGIMVDYLEYILFGGGDEPLIGAKPFGEGLQLWLKRSPGFRLDRVTAPLLLVTTGGGAYVFTMWQPYAGLRYLHKPVDMVRLNVDEHPHTNPAARMASQGGTVDWFRFWLQGYEDPDPAKAEQYKRWRELKTMQAENDKKSTAPESGSN